MIPPAPQASGTPWLARLLALVLLMLVGFALPQQAAAQDSVNVNILGTIHTVTIFDADPVDEGGTASFRVTVEPPFSFNLRVTTQYTFGSASLDDLGSDRSVNVPFDPTGTSYTISVPIEDDETAEGIETFMVGLDFGSDLNIQATGTINASDMASTVSIAPRTVDENVSGGAAVFTATLTQMQTTGTVLNVAVTAGDTNPVTLADDLGDLTDLSNNGVTIARGALSQTFMVPITNDEIVEGDETFTVTITARDVPFGLTIGTGEVTGTITDNDTAEVTLGPTTLEAAENGTFTYTVSLSAPADEAVVVRWTATDGTAIVNDDLQEQTNTVTFPANDNTAQEFTISPVDDPDDEVNETFTVTLEVDGDNPLPTGVTIGTNNSSTATITDNDVAPAITTQPTNQSVTVGDSATFMVVASGTPTPTYQWRKDGTAIVGATSATYTLASAALTDAGLYTVVVTNSAGNVTSTAATLTVTAAAPDLTVDDVTVSSASVVEGASFTINATVNNEGNGASAATTLTYYRSADATITTGDTSIATDPVSALAASGSSTQNASVSIATADTYYVGACVPTVSGETNTDNNCSTGVQVTVTAPAAPDLTVDGVTVSSASVVAGASFTINATVNNGGNAASVATTLTYYRSADATITTGDTSIATDPVGILAASGSSAQNASVSIATADTYYVGACVPTVSGETNTNNNCSTGVQVTVTAAVAPEITTQPVNQSVTVGDDATFTVVASGTSLNYQWRKDGTAIVGATSATYTISSAALTDAGSYTVVVTNSADTVTSTAATLTVTPAAPDLTVDSVSVSSASVVAGASFTINATVNNEGNAASAATTLTYYRSTDATITTDDTSIATDPISILAANGSSTQNASVSIATADTYYVGACVPTVSGETNTNNNCSTGVQVTVTAPAAPDLTVDGVSVSSASVVAGASFTINATVNNEGNAASAATTLTYYRSADATITTGDTSIATDPVSALAASGSSTQNASVSIATADTYYVGACVPTVSGETNTDNNCSTGVQVVVTAPAAPDLTVDSVSVSSASVVAGASFTINATVNNEGNAASAATTLTYYRSADATITTGDTSIATDPVSALAASGSSTQNASVSIATADTYYVGACVPTVSGETNTDNNCSTGVQVTVTAAAPSGPDLTVDGVSVSSASVVAGASFTINATVNNEGNAASAATTLTYYRSADATITTGDTSIATDPIGALAANGSSTQNASVSIATADTYYVGACVPTVSGETNTNNNCSTGVQVVVTAATPPPTVTIGIANASATEGDDIRFPVSLSTALLEPRTINVGYTAGSGNTGAGLDDLGSDRPTTLTLPTGTTSVNLDVPTVDDTTDENNETFTVTLSLPAPPTNPRNTLTITGSTATGTITDNDETPDARVSIANASVAENAAAGAIGFTVSLDRAVDSDVTLAVAYAAVTATLGTDLGTRPATVTIDRGQTEATLMVPVTNDAIAEGNETFTVTLSEGTTPLPDGVTIGTDNEATGTITDADTAGVSLSSTDPPPASEGGTITFTVELDNPVAERFSLGWAASNGTATVADDLDDQSGTVEIAADARTATFTIPVTNDDDTESSETFTVALTGAPTGLVNIAPSRVTVDRASATGTINASDTGDGNTVNIGNRTVAENVSGGSIGFTVSLDRAVGSAVTLAVAYTAGTATLDDDLRTPRPATVTINANTTSATLLVPIANETLVEGSETFTVTLSEGATPLPDGVIIGNGTATGTITNDDEAEIVTTVADVNEAGASLTFRPGVTVPVAQDLVLAWEVTGGTASAADFSQYVSSGTVTIPARQATATILFFPRDDDVVEGNETLTLTFSPAPGTTLPDGVTFRGTTATATIRDSDEVDINLRVVADVSETDERLTFRPELTGRLTQDLVLAWEVTGGTASAADFSEYVGSSTVTIRAGRGGAPIRFMPLDDDAVEGPETLELTISAVPGTSLPRGVNLGTTTATATIADSDEPPVANATVSIDDESVVENGGNAEFTVSLTTAVDSDVTLAVAYAAGTATLATDLGTRPATVTIEEGQTSATLLVPITNDETVEGNETFTVTISEGDTPLPEGVTIGTDNEATGTITEDDAAEVTLGPATLEAAEDATFTYTVSLSAPADEAVTVRWTATDGTATVDDDLQETTNTVTFAANDNTAQEFTISPDDDNDVEGNETFTVTLEVDTEGGNPLPTGVTIGAGNSSTATITDDDEAPVVTATVSIDDESVVENVSGGNATFTAALTTAVNSPVVLAVEVTAGTATLGVDLGADLPTSVTIDANTTEATFTVPITDDNIVEGNETFTVTLSESDTTDLPDGVTIRDGTATGTITENDTAEVTLTANTATANENGGTFSYTVNLSAAADEAVIVRWTATDGTAIVANDLQETTNTVTFAANTGTAQTFTISPVNDNEDEDNETFTVTLGPDTEGNNPLPTGVTIGADNTATGTIADDDDAPPPENARVNIADMTAVEDAGAIGFTVSLTRAVDSGVTLAVAYTAGSADPGTDLGTPLSATVTIPEGETRVTLSVPVIDDDIVEGAETFIVTLSEAPANRLPDDVSIGDRVATGTITDNDEEPGLTTSIRIADAAPVAEDGTGRFTITLEPRALTGDAVLDVAYAPGTATDGTQPAIPEEDLGADRPATVTIRAGRRSVVLEVPIADDDAVEGRESFTVTLSTAAQQPDDPETGLPPEFVLLFPRAEATGTITDNDEAAAPPAPEPSVLIEPRRIGAGAALRRHAGRFDSLTGALVRNRLTEPGMHDPSLSLNVTGDSRDVAVRSRPFQDRWGAWIDGAWAGIDGNAAGRQADIHGGVDYLGTGGDWLIGALIGYELADLDIGEATFRSDTLQFGLYGGTLLSQHLLFDGALAFGLATPEVAQGDVSASYDAHRFTARGALTGDFGFEHGLDTGSVRVEPQLGLLYSRETLDAFTDSAGRAAEREVLELGRFSAGPRLTWDFDGGQVAGQVTGQVTGGARVQWDFVGLEDGVGGFVSGAADIGLKLELSPGFTFGIHGDVDGIGIRDEFGSLGGKIELGVRF